jgi:hypothetical protein
MKRFLVLAVLLMVGALVMFIGTAVKRGTSHTRNSYRYGDYD